VRCMTSCGVVGMKRLWSNSRGQLSTHHNDDLWHVVFHGLDHGAVLRSHLGHLRTTPVLSTRHGEFQPVPLVPPAASRHTVADLFHYDSALIPVSSPCSMHMSNVDTASPGTQFIMSSRQLVLLVGLRPQPEKILQCEKSPQKGPQEVGEGPPACMRRARPMPMCAMSPSPPISLEVSMMTTRFWCSCDRSRDVSRITVVLPTPGRPCNGPRASGQSFACLPRPHTPPPNGRNFIAYLLIQ
jgi:hypothetical protein